MTLLVDGLAQHRKAHPVNTSRLCPRALLNIVAGLETPDLEPTLDKHSNKYSIVTMHGELER